MAGEPQSDIQYFTVNIDRALLATPLEVETGLLICPDGENCQLELVSISYRAHILPIDGTNNINIDIEFIDDSDSDSLTNIVTAFTLDDNRTALVGNQVFSGSQILDPGDVINVEYDVTTVDTDAVGACLTVGYRVLRHS